jgi:membrane protease YdiL (CAAX protease family)
MRSFIRSLSAPAEFCLVMFICFGRAVVGDIRGIANQHLWVFSNTAFLRTAVWQLVSLAAIFWIGKIRGWSIASFGWRFSWKGAGAGILLFVLGVLAQILIGVMMEAIHPARRGFVMGAPTLPFILIASIINPVFEEVSEVGYFFHSLRHYGLRRVVLGSSALRAILHAYQGINGAVSIFALGVVFGLAYWRWWQIWPLVVAHSLCDFFGLLFLARHGA